jgi:hypothetical protein
VCAKASRAVLRSKNAHFTNPRIGCGVCLVPRRFRIGGGCYIIPDIFAIEACGSLQNLLDKRSRFAPSTHSLLAVCPVPWLLAPITPTEPTPRWRATGVIRQPPSLPLVLPVRDIRVMYALKQRHYDGFAQHQVPHPHEYFLPMDALTACDAPENPAIRALVSRASASASFLAPG